MDNILIILSLIYDGSKVYVNPKNICAIYRNKHGNTELLFAGGDGGNYVTVKESAETVATMIGRAWGGPGRIEQLPSAQPEIIRCKDCRYGVNFYHDGECYCSNPKCELRYFGGSWEFYCADAERRTDG